jgi:hypothetical protein
VPVPAPPVYPTNPFPNPLYFPNNPVLGPNSPYPPLGPPDTGNPHNPTISNTNNPLNFYTTSTGPRESERETGSKAKGVLDEPKESLKEKLHEATEPSTKEKERRAYEEGREETRETVNKAKGSVDQAKDFVKEKYNEATSSSLLPFFPFLLLLLTLLKTICRHNPQSSLHHQSLTIKRRGMRTTEKFIRSSQRIKRKKERSIN